MCRAHRIFHLLREDLHGHFFYNLGHDTGGSGIDLQKAGEGSLATTSRSRMGSMPSSDIGEDGEGGNPRQVLSSLRDDGRDVAERERSTTQLAMDLHQSRGLKSLEPIRAIAHNALEIFSPTSLSGAKPTEHVVRRNAAEQARSFARTVADLSDMRDAMNRLPAEDQLAFTDRMEAGEKQATPELQAVADMLRASYDGWAKRIQPCGRLHRRDDKTHVRA